MRRKLYTLLFLLMTTFGTLMVTGCGSSLTTYFTSDFPEILRERGQQNKDIAKELLDAGFIDKTMYSNLCKQIDSQVETIVADCMVTSTDGQALNNDAVKTLASAVSAVVPRQPEYVEYEDNKKRTYKVYTGKFGNKRSSRVSDIDDITKASLSYFVASNYIIGQYLGKGSGAIGDADGVKDDGTITDEKKYHNSHWTEIKVSEPINFFGGQSDIEKALNARFRAKMYVLNADAIQNSGKSLDEVFAAIKKAVDEDNIDGVAHYFMALKDAEGNAVTLMGDGFDLIGNSKYKEEYDTSTPGIDLVMKQSLLYHDETISCKKATGKKSGYGYCSDADHAKSSETSVMTVRFTEFNKAAFDTLKETININSGAYYFPPLNKKELEGGATTNCYVLTYPISVIDSFNLDNDTGNVTAKFNDNSGMAVSIYTGKLISYEYNSDNATFSKISHEITTDDPYLTMNFDASVGDSKSSLVCDGYRLYDITIKVKKDGKFEDDERSIVVPRIILRDYLEATWAPGATKYAETMVVFGRKIRFRTDSNFWVDSGSYIVRGDNTYRSNTLQYNINNKDWCASFINVDGDEVGSLTKLYITDFCDILALAKEDIGSTTNKWENYTVKHFREAGVTATTDDCEAVASDVSPEQDELKKTTDVTSIQATTSFPGTYIGATDMLNTNSEVQRFYCVTTTKGMFDSALYSDWINSTASKESLTWWNKYLADHGYYYTIGTDKVTNYLETNFRYELSQEGPIILDLETIDKIQDIYDKEDEDGRSSFIRTIFVVLGIFLIAYSMTLMLCWVIDTNVDLGFSLTNKVTFGNWIAIQYDEELPTYNNEDKSYVNGREMLIRCLIMVAVAIVVIRVDASEIILVLIQTFGKFAAYAERVIRGLTI